MITTGIIIGFVAGLVTGVALTVEILSRHVDEIRGTR